MQVHMESMNIFYASFIPEKNLLISFDNAK